jgi:hypothetical protein
MQLGPPRGVVRSGVVPDLHTNPLVGPGTGKVGHVDLTTWQTRGLPLQLWKRLEAFQVGVSTRVTA